MCESKKITKWIVVISGYLQSEGRPSGITRLWHALQASATPGTAVLLLRWNACPAQWASLIWATCQEDRVKVPQIVLVGYSWGGQTAVNMARQLDRMGLHVSDMILSDPVYRFPFLAITKRILAFLPFFSLSIPANVKRVAWFRQRRNRPRSHDVFAIDPRRTLVWPIRGHELPVVHQYMDDATAFHEEVLRCVA